jgi:protease-4
MEFLKNFLASCLGAFIALCVFVLVAIFVISGLTAERKPVISENSVLQLNLDGPIIEQEIEDPLAELIQQAAQPMGLLQIKEAINSAKSDSKIKGIYLNVDYLVAGPSTLSELRSSLVDFKQSGKWIVAYADNYSEGAYYLATAADKIYLNPVGQVELNGLSLDVMFFKRMFDKLEIKPQIFRVGDFKSAVEPFIRENLSEENELQLNSLLQSIYGEMLSAISAARNIPEDELKAIAKSMEVRSPEQAVAYQLVDALYYDDQVKDEIKGRLELEKDDRISFTKYKAYRKSLSLSSSSKNEIAVIIAEGDILPGESNDGIVGGATIATELRRARTNDRVKAIVLRINSPGGAFQAADQMWREVELASNEKPVIASMSDYAASGGYYLAMACDSIVAQPATITGSIGVFSILFDLSQFLGNKIGITTEEVKTGDVGGLIAFTRPLTDLEKRIWQAQTDSVYETFTSKAAKGRSMTQEDIKKIASGRVWTGEQALENGLVDVLGGYNDAVRIAAGNAGIGEDYRIRMYPQPKTLIEKLMGNLEDEVTAYQLQKELGETYPWYKQWEKARQYQGVQVRMPIEFQIR